MSKIMNVQNSLSFESKDKIMRSYLLFKKSSYSRDFVIKQLARLYSEEATNKSKFTKSVLSRFNDQTKLFEKFRIEFLLSTHQFELAKQRIRNNDYLVGSDVLDYVNHIHRAVLGNWPKTNLDR
jgi:hypothetical protein